MDEPRPGTATDTVSVGATITVAVGFHSVRDLEPAIVAATHAAGRQLNARAFAALQDGWLAAHRRRFTARHWRTRHWLRPLGPMDLPLRRVRDKTSSRSLTLSMNRWLGVPASAGLAGGARKRGHPTPAGSWL